MRHGVRLVWNVVGDPEERAGAAALRPEPEDWRIRLRELADRTLASPESRAFAVRLALCMTVAEIARQYLPIERPYWVLLTVAIVLKPDFGSVFTRAVQRGAGTLLGVLLGSALLAVLPRDAWVLVAMAGFAALLPWARDANFGLFSVFQTPVIILLLDLALPAGPGLVGARLIDTLIGCGIVLVFGYLLWPQTWRAPLDEALRATTLALDAFVEAAFTGSPADRRRARRRTYRALTELQTQLQRRLAEPPPISTRAAAWWPVIVQLERTADAVTEAVIATRGGEPAPDLAQVAVLRRAIRRLEDDVRAHRRPRRRRDPRRRRPGAGGPRGGRRPPAGPGGRPRPPRLTAEPLPVAAARDPPSPGMGRVPTDPHPRRSRRRPVPRPRAPAPSPPTTASRCTSRWTATRTRRSPSSSRTGSPPASRSGRSSAPPCATGPGWCSGTSAATAGRAGRRCPTPPSTAPAATSARCSTPSSRPGRWCWPATRWAA